MVRYVLLICVFSILFGCGGSDTQPQSPVIIPPITGVVTPVISRSASYTYTFTTDIKYAEGLTHSDWNSPDPIAMDLLLDAYIPDNDFNNRPAVIFIHGGGFTGGDKSAISGSNTLSYLAERGFVGFSINYRLVSDYGTIPDEFSQAVEALPGLSARQKDQGKAFYPAGRDSKAALSWLFVNATTYGIDTNSVSIVGSSAGAYIAMALGVTEPEDYREELSIALDPTVNTTNLDQTIEVHSIIDLWGSGSMVDIHNGIYGHDRWDNTDAPVAIVHGTEDQTVLFEEAVKIRDKYESTNVYYKFYSIEGGGHGLWNSIIDGQTIEELILNFIVDSQSLNIDD